MKLAVVLTCFNRIEKTKKCINTLLMSKNNCKESVEVKFFVCDDCSSDGTKEMLKTYGNAVAIIEGTGSLFWARGMARALLKAEKWEPDFYFMVNDDVEFEANAIEIMLNSYDKYGAELHAIVGATRDGKTKEFTYGGYMWNWKAYPKTIVPIYPESEDKTCNTANWNCLLIPRELYEKVGKIDTVYEHSYADFDYSNRVTLLGYKMYTAECYIGYCSRNSDIGSWRDKSLTVKERLRLLHKPTGYPPKSNWHYCRKYYGGWAVYMFVRPYLSIFKNGMKKR